MDLGQDWRKAIIRRPKRPFALLLGRFRHGRPLAPLADTVQAPYRATVLLELREYVTVPDLWQNAHLYQVQSLRKDLSFGTDWQRWASWTGGQPSADGRGKTYEVKRWRAEAGVDAEKVCAYFHGLGFQGDVNAFLAWLAGNHAQGTYATIPSKNERYRRRMFARDVTSVPICHT